MITRKAQRLSAIGQEPRNEFFSFVGTYVTYQNHVEWGLLIEICDNGAPRSIILSLRGYAEYVVIDRGRDLWELNNLGEHDFSSAGTFLTVARLIDWGWEASFYVSILLLICHYVQMVPMLCRSPCP